MSNEIEIFRTGRFQSIDGRTLSFADGDLADTVASYDPALHRAPHVIGHPKMDAPAYGWVTRLEKKGDRLVANIDQCDPAFAELVRAGRYGKVSAAFYDPDDDNNPVPGTYYLRHVGWLGATPPAVKGLKPAQFAAGDKYIAFGEETPAPERGGLSWLSRFIRGQVHAEVTRMIEPAHTAMLTTTDNPGDDMTAFAEQQRQLDARKAELDREAADLASRETAVKTKEAAFAETARKRARREHEAYLDGLEKDGRAVPAWRKPLLAIMDRLHEGPAVAFGEDDGAREVPMVDAFCALLDRMPKMVEFSEVARTPIELRPTAPPADFPTPPGMRVDEDELAIRDAALAYAEKHKVAFEVAVQRVMQGE